MKLAAVFLLATALPAAQSATITVTISGTTGEIKVGEGPIFGHSSYQKIPPGDPFVLTYTFDDEKGKQAISGINGETITQSETENAALSSPGTNAVLQIGSAVWEFGASTRAQVKLQTSANSKSEQFVYSTQAGSNRISSQIVPAKDGYWPKNGDWRSSFTSASLEGSTASFSADNDRVSASGSLFPPRSRSPAWIWMASGCATQPPPKDPGFRTGEGSGSWPMPRLRGATSWKR